MEFDTEQFDTELVVTATVYGLTFVVGMVGNILIVYSVINFRRMKSLSNVFLASLASADLMLIVFCVPVKFVQLFSYTWTLGELPCKLVHYVQNVSAISSVYTLTAMSIERYYAIMHPVECRYICTMSQTKRTIALTWLLSLVAGSPVWWMQILRSVGNVGPKGYWCVRDWDNKLMWQLYELYMFVLILVAPVVVMSYSYLHICAKLRSVMRDRSGQTLDAMPMAQSAVYIDASASKMSQVIKMLIVVVVIFVLCWSPILTVNLLSAFGFVPALNYSHLKLVRTTFHLMSYANSCVNPIVYGFMSRNFRASFRAAIHKWLGCAPNQADLQVV